MKTSKIQNAFNPETFRKQGHQLIDTLSDFLEKSLSGKEPVVLPDIDPESMLKRWSGSFKKEKSTEYC